MATTVERVIEGTWEEIKQHEAELVGRRLKVIIREPQELERISDPEGEPETTASQSARVSAMGKYAGRLNSEEFMHRKHEETLREDKPIR